MKHIVWLFSLALAWPQTAWREIYDRTEALYISGDLPGAAEAAKQAYDAATAPLERAMSAARRGFVATQRGRLSEGDGYLAEAMAAWPPDEKDTAEYATALLYRAITLRDLRRTAEAIPLATQAATIREKRLSASDPLIAESYNILGTVYDVASDFHQARSSYEKALALHGPRARASGELGTLYAQLGQLYQRLGEYRKAEPLLSRALEVLAENPGKAHPAYPITLAIHARLLADLAHYVQAEREFSEAISLMREKIPGTAQFVSALNNHGVLLMTTGNWRAAEAVLRESLELKRNLKLFHETPATLRNLGHLLMRRNPAESEACLQEALRLLRGDRPVPVFELVAVLLTFADLKSSQGDLEGAQRMIEEALAVGDASIGKFSQPAANAHSSLGDLLRARGSQAEAESHYRIALEILTKIKGSDHPDLVRPLRSLARLHRERREFPAALEHYRRAETIVAAVYSQSMTLAGPDAKAAALANIGDSVPELLDFQREAAAQVPGSRELALEAVAARKSRVLSFLRDWRQDLRRHLGSRADERFEHWQELVDCRAALSVALEYREVRTPAVGGCTFKSEAFGAGYAAVVHALRNAPTPAAAERALAALGQVRSRLAGLEESLARSYPPLGNLLRGTSAQDIRKALQRGDALLELVRTADGRYGAFLLTTGGEPEWFDLGPAKPVDAAVRKLLRNANDWATSMALGERAGVRASATNFDNASASLSGFFQPVLSRLARSKAVRRLRIAPDGMLALVPFEGMKTGGSYVLERYEVSYVNSGIELAEMRQPLKPPGRPVIAVSPGPGGTKVTPRKAAFRAELLERLPGAREEARKLRMYFSDAEVVAEGRASEAYLKRVAGPGVFHIIGHGLFRSDADCAAEAGNCRAHADPAQRATELSAIVLDEVYGRGGSSTEDGFLTALELQSVDLSGTLMLVLSQCRMADGVPQSGEGVHGMRRAAMVAGAQTLVAPLWKVADRAQSLAMTAFYDALRQGRGRGAALRSAKLSLLRGKQYRHPLFWSSTILAGDDGPLPANLLRRHVH